MIVLKIQSVQKKKNGSKDLWGKNSSQEVEKWKRSRDLFKDSARLSNFKIVKFPCALHERRIINKF